MADERTAGFLDALGFQGVNSPARFRQVRGGSQMADAANIVRSAGRGPATRAIAGGLGAIGGLISGDGGRGIGEFGRDFQRGVQDFDDRAQAEDLGITPEKLRTRRALRKELDETVDLGKGSLEEQINAMTTVARKANAAGDIEIALQASQMKAQLRKQLEAQKQAGIESEQAQIELDEDKGNESIGIEASMVGRDDLGDGKAVRIDSERAQELGLEETDIGKFLFVDKDGNRQVVDGADIVPKSLGFGKLGIGTLAPKDDNILKLAAANGATSGNINKLRGSMVEMGKQAGIVTDVSNLLLNMSNPEFALDLTGKTAIQANRMVRFADNAAKILTEADGGVGAAERLGKYEWNGKAVGSAQEQHRQFTDRAKEEGFLLNTMNRIAGDTGLPKGNTLNDFMPSGILENLQNAGASAEQIARVSEQYWANVMELAYLDARLQEPSNRGLSDKDIQNALKRIGAATANPASFAQRQLTLINRLQDAMGSLGSTLTVPSGARTDRNDVVDFIYAPAVRQDVTGRLAQAEDTLGDLESLKTRSRTPVDTGKIEAFIKKGDQLTQDDIDSMSDAEFEAFKKRRQGQ